MLGHRDEEHVRDKPSTGEVFRREILCLINGLSVMIEPVRQSLGAMAPSNFGGPFTGAFGPGPADIDRRRRSGDAAIERVAFWPSEVDSIYATSPERKKRVELYERTDTSAVSTDLPRFTRSSGSNSSYGVASAAFSHLLPRGRSRRSTIDQQLSLIYAHSGARSGPRDGAS